MSLKIAVSGTDSTGKSTLVKEISRRYNVPAIPEFAREIASEMGFKNLRNITTEETFRFQNAIVDRKIAEEARYPSFIADRSTADNMAYYLRWCAREVDDVHNKVYVERCKRQLKTYDMVVLLPWGIIPHDNDGFRTSKLYYSYEIHCLLVGILQDLKVPYTVLEEADFERRVEYFSRFYGSPREEFELQSVGDGQPAGVL